METCLAMTIFREEFNVEFCTMFTVLTFVKVSVCGTALWPRTWDEPPTPCQATVEIVMLPSFAGHESKPMIVTFTCRVLQVFHWLVSDRVEYLETTPAGSRLQHIRIVAFMLLLLVSTIPCPQYI